MTPWQACTAKQSRLREHLSSRSEEGISAITNPSSGFPRWRTWHLMCSEAVTDERAAAPARAIQHLGTGLTGLVPRKRVLLLHVTAACSHARVTVALSGGCMCMGGRV